MDNHKYTYAVARINALSAKLLDHEFASRILASTPEEIVNIVKETALAESFSTIETPLEVESGLRKELRKAYDLYEKICPNKEASRLFRYRHDFHNLKAMLKAKVRGIPHDEFLLDLCTFDTAKMEAAVSEGSYRQLPEHLRNAARQSVADYEKTGSLAAISCACDRVMWQYIMQRARATRERIVIDLFREYINLANLKSFFRFRDFSTDIEVFKRHFIPEGDYSLDFFLHYMDEDLALFLDHLAKTRYEQEIVLEGLKTWPEEKSFWRLEKASDNFLLRYFSRKRLELFSIAPLIYYLLRKIAETRLIRTVIKCKMIGMPRDMIEDRLRCIYV